MSGLDLDIQAGPKALAHIKQHGLTAADIAVVAGAAGGPKGLILNHIDQWVFGQWLPQAPRKRACIGASIGAWRMAAAMQPDAAQAFVRLAKLYSDQRYPHKPSPEYVSEVSADFVRQLIAGNAAAIANHSQHQLHVLVARGKRGLSKLSTRATMLAGFGGAIAANLVGRKHLASHLDRVVFANGGQPNWLDNKFDAFTNEAARLDASNMEQALLASGTLPFIMAPVRDIPHAKSGFNWDGGLIDYHLALPYPDIATENGGGLVLYPHFISRIVPGWFDKSMPWRHAARGAMRHWLDNVILISPSKRFVARLPRRKLPDRNDFYHYANDAEMRVREWTRAIAESERLRDEWAQFVESPDLTRVKPLY